MKIFDAPKRAIANYITDRDVDNSKARFWLRTMLLFAGLNNFLAIISFIGGVTLGLEGIIILMMYQKIRPDRKILTYPLGLAMFAAMFYEIIYFFK